MDASSLTTFHDSLGPVLAHVIQDFMRLMKKHGLSTSQIHAMMYIYHAGECQVSDIGALADASNAAASQLVERLVQQGLVERKEDPTNRRTKIVRLTENGRGLIHASIPSNHTLMGMLASLPPAQREIVKAALEILTQAARQIHASDPSKDGNHA